MILTPEGPEGEPTEHRAKGPRNVAQSRQILAISRQKRPVPGVAGR